MKRFYGDADRTPAFSEERHADGSSEVHSYDTQGRETTSVIVGVSGRRDVVQSTYVGPSEVASTSVHTRYAPDGSRLFVDQTLADGSHVQFAAKGGVTLISHSDVSDTLYGLAGSSEIFAFGKDFGRDTVLGFETGTSAHHDVLNIDAGYASDFAALMSKATQKGGDVLITLDGDDAILLKNAALANLTPDHVQFASDDFGLV